MLDEALMLELFGGVGNFPTSMRERHVKKSDRIVQNMELKDVFRATSKEKIMMPVKEKKPFAKETEFSSYRHEVSEKPRDNFSFEEHIKEFNEQMQSGHRKLGVILSALEWNKKACSYVSTYFYVDNVKCSVKKLRKRITEQIKFNKELQEKYGDNRITNYQEAIEIEELILKTLNELITSGKLKD